MTVTTPQKSAFGMPVTQKARPDQQTLHRGGQPGSDQGRDGDVPEAVPQDLGVAGREGDEGPDLLPGRAGGEEQVIEPEEGDGQLDAQPGGGADQAQRRWRRSRIPAREPRDSIWAPTS